MKKILLLSVLFLLFTVFLSAQEKVSGVNKDMILIDQDYQSGNITYEEALLQKFYYGFDKSKLNSQYKSVAGTQPLKCGTELVMEYKKNKSKLSFAAVEEIEEFLNRAFVKTAATKTYISPSGKFELTYETTGTHAVPTTDSDSDGVPDYIEWVASYFDYSWTFTFDTLGYLPIPIGSGRYQIGFENMEYYGYTNVVNEATGITHIVMENDYKGFSSNDDPEGKQKGAAKVTAIHEFKHAVQFVYNKWSDPGWLLEMDATWMEDTGYDYVNDYYGYLYSSQITNPARAFSEGEGYEDCIFLHYISQKFGVLSNRQIWERRKAYPGETVYTTFDKILAGYSSSYEEGLREYFAWNYAAGSRATGLFDSYEEAANYPTSVLCLDKSSLPDSSEGCSLSPSGAAFLKYKSNGENTYFDITISSTQAGPYGAEILIAYTNGTSERISTDLGSSTIKKTILKSLKDISYLVVIPVVVATTGNARSYSCKIAPLSSAGFSMTPVSDTESTSEKTITVVITDTYNISVVDSLQLHYNINNSGYHAVKMLPTGSSNEFSAVIPNAPLGSTITYYLSIYDIFSRYAYYPAGGSVSPFQYFMGADVTPPSLVHSERKVLNKYNFPFSLYAEADDNIGIDSVYAEYIINGISVFRMTLQEIKDGVYSGEVNLPGINPDDVNNFSYKIVAVDSSGNHNQTVYPDEGYVSINLSNSKVYTSAPAKEIKDIFVLGIKDTIIVSQDIKISDIDISLDITHSRVSDLVVKILPPFGKTAILFSRPGSGTDFASAANPDIILDQDAYFSIKEFEPDNSNNLTGTFKPDTLNLNAYNDSSAAGKWILVVSDNLKDEKGVLNEWKLIISTNSIVSVDEDHNNQVVNDYNLLQNYPNPFNPSTVISYIVPAETFVELKVFDVLGREVSLLVNEVKKAGTYNIKFNAANLSSGVYFYRLKTDNFSSVKKMIFIQ